MKVILSYNLVEVCRKCSLIASFLLLFQSSFAQQYNFADADNWLKDNLDKLGGRAVLVILKVKKIIYEHAENKSIPEAENVWKIYCKKTG